MTAESLGNTPVTGKIDKKPNSKVLVWITVGTGALAILNAFQAVAGSPESAKDSLGIAVTALLVTVSCSVTHLEKRRPNTWLLKAGMAAGFIGLYTILGSAG